MAFEKPGGVDGEIPSSGLDWNEGLAVDSPQAVTTMPASGLSTSCGGGAYGSSIRGPGTAASALRSNSASNSSSISSSMRE
jgi:hypothetical protein